MPTANASLLLGFNYGGSNVAPVTNQVDAFTGATGSGWAGPWILREQTADRSNISATVINTSPFGPGMGNYLSVQYESLNNSNARAGVVRRFSTTPGDGGVNATQNFSLNFDFRADAYSGAFDQATDQILFSTGITDAAGGFATASPLRIWYVGNGGWRVNDGDAYVSIPGLSATLTTGLVYDFNVDIHPATLTWDISVGYNGNVYSLTGLDLWSATSVADANYLSMRTMRNNGATFTWSTDNLQTLQSIPEPGGLILSLGGVICLITRRRSRESRNVK